MPAPLGLLSKDAKIVLLASYASAATDRNSEVLDTAGFSNVLILVCFAAVHDSVTQDIFLVSSDTATDQDTLSSGSNVANSSQTVVGTTADNTIQYIDFIPEKRYYLVTVNKDGTNASAELIVAILYNAESRPTTHGLGTSTVGEGTGAVTGENLGLAIQGTK